MSLAVARYIACSAMMTTELQSAVAAANIANADTAGYTKKTANQTNTVTGGVSSGVTVTGITSSVNQLLLKSLIGSAADLGAATTTNDYLDQLQSLFGSTSGSDSSSGTSLANTLASLETAISSLADTPESASLQAAVVDDLDAVASQLRSTSSGIQQLRANADQEISDSVDQVNQALSTIADLNDQITQAAAIGQPTSDLEDERNTALQTLGSLMNISYFKNSSGAMQVYTASGQVLLDSSVHEVSYTAASTVVAGTSYSATPPSGFSAITVNGKDITGQIASGKIGALINLRDNVLPQAQSELDELATTLASSLNAVHNQGTALPPPSSLTGTSSVSAADTLSGSGTARFAVTDGDGNLVSYADLDLSSYATVGDLVSAINGISGLSASIDASGHVAVTADDSGNGVAINEMTSSVGTDAQGLSDWLGLNDLVTATGASDFAVRGDILGNSSLLAVSKLDSSANLTAGSSVVSAGSTAIISSLYDTLTGSTAFDAAGGLGTTKTSFASYAADVVADVAAKSSDASTTYTNKKLVQSNFASAMSSQTGVNVDEETSQLSALQNSYSAAAEIISILNQMFTSLLDAVQSAA
jgi:flagellar hook-associated protein 1 FlgK